jgi:hypothetical protein
MELGHSYLKAVWNSRRILDRIVVPGQLMVEMAVE